jgi:hypothetical protein
MYHQTIKEADDETTLDPSTSPKGTMSLTCACGPGAGRTDPFGYAHGKLWTAFFGAGRLWYNYLSGLRQGS